jgi:putative glutamine amidotransferase
VKTCDNEAYGLLQIVNRQALVVYREVHELAPYHAALVAGGVNAVPLPVNSPIPLGDYFGLVLTGGTDVDPALYGEARHAETDEPDSERDAVETELLEQAFARDLPVLAICRGLQLLNVATGGSLIQHLDPPDRHRRKGGDRSLPVHSVTIQSDTLLSSIAGTQTWHVNSRHHQAVRTVGENLRVCAFDPEDGTVEALERPDRTFVLAVQWHPENQVLRDAEQLKLFRSFAAMVG